MSEHHDGIRELDNVLPRWWLQILWGTVLFAVGYWLWYQVLGSGELPVATYRREKLAAAQAEAERLKGEGELTGDRLLALSKNVAIVGAGKATFTATCAPCHRADGGGQVGPNLTDEFWLHGGKPLQIAATIRRGYVDKGMPAWGAQLGEERVREVAAYVLTLRNTHVAGGKPPQGDREE
jgi:cytochrome c oxidase cbb3-type subunit 3